MNKKTAVLCIVSVLVFILAGNAYAQEEESDLCHFVITSDKSPQAQVYDLGATDYDTNGDLIEFSDESINAEISGINADTLNIRLAFGGKTYKISLAKKGPQIKKTIANGATTYNFLSDVKLGDGVMGGKSISLKKDSFIVIIN